MVRFKGVNAKIKEHIFIRIKKLYEKDKRLHAFWENIDMNETLHELEDSRINNIIELDKLIADVYRVKGEELLYIVSNFPRFYDEASISYLEKINEPD